MNLGWEQLPMLRLVCDILIYRKFKADRKTEIIAMRMPTGGDGYNKQVDVFSIGMTYLVMSESSLQNSDNRFLLWKDLIEPNGKLWPSAGEVAKILAGKNYGTFSGNDNLLQVIAKALCSPTERYADAGAFQSAFEGAV